LAGAVGLGVDVLAGTVTVILGLPPIGTISYNDMAQAPPQVLVLSPRGKSQSGRRKWVGFTHPNTVYYTWSTRLRSKERLR
jgi:hypothetical protein